MQNGLKSNEWRRISFKRIFKIEKQKGGPNNSDILQNWFPPEVISRILIYTNLKTLRKVLLNHAEDIEMQWTTKNLGP